MNGVITPDAQSISITRNDPYHLNSVWGNVQIHRYNKKLGLPITSRERTKANVLFGSVPPLMADALGTEQR